MQSAPWWNTQTWEKRPAAIFYTWRTVDSLAWSDTVAWRWSQSLCIVSETAKKSGGSANTRKHFTLNFARTGTAMLLRCRLLSRMINETSGRERDRMAAQKSRAWTKNGSAKEFYRGHTYMHLSQIPSLYQPSLMQALVYTVTASLPSAAGKPPDKLCLAHTHTSYLQILVLQI